MVGKNPFHLRDVFGLQPAPCFSYAPAVDGMRYEIEDMLTQDAHGAVFLATDSTTGEAVWLQRFFPFGASSGGLEGAEKASFQASVDYMKQWHHPSLRRMIDGGCDAVDNIPFIVTEAPIEPSLTKFFSAGPLSMTQGRQLAEQALLLMLELERLYGTGGEWLIWRSDDIEVFDEGMRYRFSMDPMKWIGARKSIAPIKDLAALVETAMGWAGRVITGSTMGSLSGWVRQVRSQEYTAAQALALLRGENPLEQAPAATVQAAHVAAAGELATGMYISPPPVLLISKKPSYLPWVIASIFLTLGIAAFFFVQYSNKKNLAEASAQPSPAATSAAKNPQEIVDEKLRKIQEGSTPNPAESLRQGDYQPVEVELVRPHIGKQITLLGTVTEVRVSSSDKTIYIEYNTDRMSLCGRYLVSNGKPDMTLDELSKLTGKSVRLKGEAQVEYPTKRIVINLTDRSQIQEVP